MTVESTHVRYLTLYHILYPDYLKSNLNLGTLKPTLYDMTLNDRQIQLLDTPGFDDSTKNNIELLQDIVAYLWYLARFPDHFQVQGVIFLHDISETRFSGSQRTTLSILKQICGDKALGNVIVGTTMWNSTNPKKLSEQKIRENAIKTEHWIGIHKIIRLPEDDRDAAASIVTELLSKPPVPLLVQQEMLVPPHALGCTTVGKEMISAGEKDHERLKKAGNGAEAGIMETLLNALKNPPELSFVEKLGVAIAAPIILAPAALVAAPVGVIAALVHLGKKVTG